MDLLAARSLVFVQLLEKNEMTGVTEPFPHTKDEVEAIRLTGALTFEDCRRVFPEIRAARTLGRDSGAAWPIAGAVLLAMPFLVVRSLARPSRGPRLRSLPIPTP